MKQLAQDHRADKLQSQSSSFSFLTISLFPSDRPGQNLLLVANKDFVNAAYLSPASVWWTSDVTYPPNFNEAPIHSFKANTSWV